MNSKELFERALAEKVTGTSLLRSVPPSTVSAQFHRMALGGARLTEYEFSYTAPRRSRLVEPLSLSFTVALCIEGLGLSVPGLRRHPEH